MSAVPPDTIAEGTKPSAGKVWLKRLLNLAIVGLTVYFLAGHFRAAWHDFQEKQVELRWGWVAVATGLYTLGLGVFGVPFAVTLRNLRTAVAPGVAAAVYALSHIAKYIPGKAMVIVVRCGLLAPRGAGAGATTIASFYETFLTMASGSAIALLVFTVLPVPAEIVSFLDGAFRRVELPAALAPLTVFRLGLAALAAGFCGAVLPPVFRVFCRAVAGSIDRVRRRSGAAPTTGQLHTPGYPAMLTGIAVGVVGWAAWGLSYHATMQALSAEPLPLRLAPLLTAAVALGTVVGFLSMLPGALGVRELILIQALLPLFGGVELVPVAASLLFRLETVAAEAAVAAVVYAVLRRSAAAEGDP